MKAYLEPQEIDLLEGAARCFRDRLLIRLTFRLACRISESLGIAVADIDFDRATVTITHLKKRVKRSCPACGANLSRAHVFCPGCGRPVDRAIIEEREHRPTRNIPVDGETLRMAREYIDRGGPVVVGDKELLFGISRGQAWRIIRDCAQRAGLPRLVNPESGKVHNVSPHKLRDAFAVLAVKRNDSGDGLRMLQEQLGHRSIETTMRYRKVAGTELRKWYDGIWGEGHVAKKYGNETDGGG